MDNKIVIAILLIALVVEHILRKAATDSCMDCVDQCLDYAKSVKEQHDRYVELANTMREWYKTCLESNETIEKQLDVVGRNWESFCNVLEELKKAEGEKEWEDV